MQFLLSTGFAGKPASQVMEAVLPYWSGRSCWVLPEKEKKKNKKACADTLPAAEAQAASWARAHIRLWTFQKKMPAYSLLSGVWRLRSCGGPAAPGGCVGRLVHPFMEARSMPKPHFNTSDVGGEGPLEVPLSVRPEPAGCLSGGTTGRPEHLGPVSSGVGRIFLR